MKNKEVLRIVKEERKILRKIKLRKANWNGHILRRNCLLKRVIEGNLKVGEDEEEDLSSYWMTVLKREGARIRKRKQHSALYGELAVDLSQDTRCFFFSLSSVISNQSTGYSMG
jgi:hypothetical protein